MDNCQKAKSKGNEAFEDAAKTSAKHRSWVFLDGISSAGVSEAQCRLRVEKPRFPRRAPHRYPRNPVLIYVSIPTVPKIMHN